jgi:putative mRNA 3-end processing factor
MLKINHKGNIILEHNNNFISIDPINKQNNYELNFITHAHKDHFSLRKQDNSTYFTTTSTLDIINNVFNAKKDGKLLELNKKYKIDDLQYKIINSGHVLGSFSIILEHNGTKITITSDINNVDSTTTKAVIPEDTDILIIESTFGAEKDVFPDRTKEYTRFLRWLMLNRLNGKLPIITAYPLGKTQEIVKLISDNTNFNIGLTTDAYEITKIYAKHKIELKNFERINGNVNDLDLLILPPPKLTKTLIDALATTNKKSLAIASVTGQQHHTGERFKISDHCDVLGLLGYIEESNAKQVYTYHGNEAEFSKIIAKKLGCYTKPLKEIKTLEII